MHDLRRTHPNLYKAYTVYALACIMLGLNFFFLTPAFNPLDLSKYVPGGIFLAIGVAELVFLNAFRSTAWLRLSIAVMITAMFFWTGALVFDFIRLDQTSLQLPITFAALGLLAVPLLLEPPTNPITSIKRGG